MRATTIAIDIVDDEYIISVLNSARNIDRAFAPLQCPDCAKQVALDLYDLLEDLGLTPAMEPSDILMPEDVEVRNS